MGLFSRQSSGIKDVQGGMFTLEQIEAEWPLEAQSAGDLQTWERGLVLYEEAHIADVVALRNAVRHLGAGLSHHLYEDRFLPYQRVPTGDGFFLDTIWSVCAGSIMNRQEHEFTAADERHLRLGLTVIRRYGLQPRTMGGDGSLDEFFEDRQYDMASHLVLGHGTLVQPEQFFRAHVAVTVFVGSHI